MIGAVLLALWIPLFAITLWAFPRPATGSELGEAVASGSVTGWALVGASTNEPAMGSSAWNLGADRRDSVDPSAAAYVLWRSTDQRRHLTDIDAVPVPAASLSDKGTAVQAWLTDQLVRDQAQYGSHDPREPGTVENLLRGGLLLTALAGVLGGVQPRFGTRWFWFWLIGLSGGLGVAAYAVIEGVRAGAPTSRRKPLRGWAGLAVLVVGSDLVSGLVGFFG